MRNESARLASPRSPPRWARLAVAATFFIAGVVQANWVSRIPTIQNALNLDNAALGLTLLGLPIGLLVAAPLTSLLMARFGSRAVTRAAGVGYCLSLALPALAPEPALLFLALLIFGFASGTLDVSMNTQAAVVEQRYGRPIMSSFHALFSTGGLLGSVVGGAVASRGISPATHLLIAAAVLAIMAFFATVRLLPRAAGIVSSGPALTRPSKSLMILGAIGFCALLSEGAVADWSGIYLRDIVGAPEGVSAAGFAAFSLAMAAGRFSGDWLNQRIGPVRLLRMCGALSAFGLLLALLVPRLTVVILGFGCVGAGLSTMFPLVVSAAGGQPASRSGAAIATITTISYFAFLVGPPLIGFASEAVTLSGALGIVVALDLLVVFLASAVRHGH